MRVISCWKIDFEFVNEDFQPYYYEKEEDARKKFEDLKQFYCNDFEDMDGDTVDFDEGEDYFWWESYDEGYQKCKIYHTQFTFL